MSKFQVQVVSVSSKTVPLVKTLRLVADLGLAEANSLSDYLQQHTPCVLMSGINQEVADHVAKLLREVGANIRVETSSIETPMLLYPKANERYKWHWFYGPTPV